MSMHKIPLTPTEEAGLRAHGLDIGTPSQLSDVFRQGVAWGQKAERENMIPAEISAYELPGGLRIERVAQRDGTFKWAIRNQMNDCMNRDCEFECELSPSNRDDAFLERCRFGSAKEAHEVWMRSNQKKG